MIDSLYIGATGMNAQQLNIDTVANNLANVNTSGFKRSRTEFADLVYRTVDLAGAANGGRVASGRMGMGTAVSGSAKLNLKIPARVMFTARLIASTVRSSASDKVSCEVTRMSGSTAAAEMFSRAPASEKR